MECYSDRILIVGPDERRLSPSFSTIKAHRPLLLIWPVDCLISPQVNKAEGKRMKRTVQKLLVAFLLGAISCSLTPGIAEAQVGEKVKVEPKRKPTRKTKGKKIDVPNRKTKPGENSTEDPLGIRNFPPKSHNHENSHKDGSPPKTNSPQDSCKMSYKDDPSAQLKCEERKRKSILKGKATGPPA